MGRGNWIPKNTLGHEGFYVDYDVIYGEDYEERVVDDTEFWYNCFIEELTTELCKNFKFKSTDGYLDRDTRAILENELVKVVVADNETTLAVYVVIPDDDNSKANLANRLLKHYKRGLLSALKIIVPNGIYERSSAWTSRRIEA